MSDNDDYSRGYDDGFYDNDDIVGEKDKEIAALVATNMTLWEENERLRVENEKLRAALKPFAEYSSDFDDEDETASPFILVKHLRAAAAALKETGDE